MTKPTKVNNPSIKMGGLKILELSAGREEAGSSSPAATTDEAPCLKKMISKSEIADQIGLHLRSVYDDIVAQPVPGRFLELLRKLESASLAASNKDTM